MEPKDGRRRLLDLDLSGVSQEDGEEPRDSSDSLLGIVVNRGGVGLGCRTEEAREAMAKVGPSIKRAPGSTSVVLWKRGQEVGQLQREI